MENLWKPTVSFPNDQYIFINMDGHFLMQLKPFTSYKWLWFNYHGLSFFDEVLTDN